MFTLAEPRRHPDGFPVLSPLVRCAPFWWNFAWLILNNHKPIETRGRQWPYKPDWLAIYATKGCGGAKDRPVLPEGVEVPKDAARESITGLIWISGSRPLVESDTAAACYPWVPERWAWEIGAVVPFATPIPIAETGLRGGPQSIVHIQRHVITRALCAS